ncbi:MAG TPA: tRNA uridine-5-carboxymethylaminomethyl(34) synthesis enzyme MnmG [Bacteroidales bacterium]|nr:MAG: tRNA uridine-5-carboxymethylaminomethyl(34) synthesis enzyme MnmG [Bacteroidetes bacterium GWE2_42_24]OFY27313.1 MAG: tRNA uridine-5-carboxymethylaminomethyl(34) synthesis enzyme MnmG [Bacteroidetes bacterium GWF2_43_11]HAQ65064.1 tRNA uridine-5-carboxymethylaminomethyl(34) synthesis enzyme MnmG [Bacteroidales bacterium]HBZ65941.1 tRNA uridine-5-carboxymethylaminomethyl(34) synthesis enzyme MnmG [Bacteroidales bacterium]
MFDCYDVIVVGAGHAGCEAAHAIGTLGSRVLLITMNMGAMGQMSCNPSIGGIAKGQIVREIDALGGMSGVVADHTTIQFRMLNKSKGPAMWSPRAQNDRVLFSLYWRQLLEGNLNVDFLQDTVLGLVVNKNGICGVTTQLGYTIQSKAVVLTNGTFLNGVIHIGTRQFSGGRIGEGAAVGLTASLRGLGFHSDRMKTGTPVRVDGRTIDFAKLEEQKGDENPGRFSFISTPQLKQQRSCFIAYTSEAVHDTLRTGFEFSPMFSGRIQGIGPRYCPSIEDKIERFSHRTRHQLFVEPEGWNTVEYYINGFSSSLPDDVQVAALRKVVGFEKAKIFRPGYAIEYDYFPPVQLTSSLETKLVPRLFFAGQINGTTGYEEAAAQGLLAGINAHRRINDLYPLILNRSEAYIGVLIDDLITKGVDEPYRMFTSRAEYRTLLRQDNADIRLTPLGYKINLASADRMRKLETKIKAIDTVNFFLNQTSIEASEVNNYLAYNDSATVIQKQKLASLLLRPQVSLEGLAWLVPKLNQLLLNSGELAGEVSEEVEILIKYAAYISKEKELADKLNRYESLAIPIDIDYLPMVSLSTEARQKLSVQRPETIGQASRISGINPSDISVLLVFLGR